MEEKVINLYLSGYGSTTIIKMLPISKRKVLKILNDNGLIKKNNYNGYIFKDGKWWYYYICDECNSKIECYANEKYLLHRNMKKKNICKECSLEKQKGEGNPFYGKKHTKETKRVISENRVGKATGEDNAMSNVEHRKKVGEKLKELWLSGEMETVRKKMSNFMKKRIANGEIEGFNRSKAEDEIIKKLKEKGINCIDSFNIEGKIFDVYVPKYNLLIEYNGDYWHCNPKKYNNDYFNKKKNKIAEDIWEYDKKKIDLAKKNDYNCITIWESDYKKNPKMIENIIKKYEKNN
tara:strand:- start:5017 stop:5892 length:876 start_codon:yes stop_codon:yes gene_type:complete